jgi:hypothetical protein
LDPTALIDAPAEARPFFGPALARETIVSASLLSALASDFVSRDLPKFTLRASQQLEFMPQSDAISGHGTGAGRKDGLSPVKLIIGGARPTDFLEMKSRISLAGVCLAATAWFLSASFAVSGPPAPCGYYPNSLIPQQCGNFYAQPAAQPIALCRDGSYSYSGHPADACADHGGVQSWFRR